MQQKQHASFQQPPKTQTSEKTQNNSSDSMSSVINGNGPRVSFNRDVHVKRIGPRPNELNYQDYDSNNLRRELPDLSEDALRREAALILKQAEYTKHRGGRANEPGHGKASERKSQGKRLINNNPHFNSLPTRGKKKTKVVSRSVSDASTKKHKKPSVFSLFGRKSDQNLDKLDNNNKSPKKVARSKSDVGTSRTGRRSSTENDDSSQSKKKAPLSPIIEASPRDDYFVGRSSPPLFHTKFGDKVPSAAEPLVNPTKPISEAVKSAIADLSQHSKSLEEMHLHSSQQPTKARLTKGMTVDGMVKRLSMERFSPPPTDQAFSYIRPKDQIIYAQVVCNNDGNNKQTVHQEFDSSLNRKHSSHFNQVTVNNKTLNSHDFTDSATKREKNNFSDEDEGLGNEPKKYFFCEPNSRNSPKFFNSDEEFKSFVDDAPITPNFRNVAPEKYLLGDRPRGDGCEFYPEFNDLAHDLARRREMMQSRIKSRIGSRDMLDVAQHDKEWLRRTKRDIYREPERIEQIRRTLSKEFLGPTPEPRRMKSISPEHSLKDYTHRDWSRSHLDIASPVPEKRMSTSKSRERSQHQTQTTVGKYEREIRKKERLHSPDIERVREFVDNVGENLDNRYHTEVHHRRSVERILTASPDNTLQRQKKIQKSFDKGDSGIENDYRKDSFNNHSKFRRKRTVEDDIIEVDHFLKRERSHTQVTHLNHFIKHFGNPRRAKERSIDDGSRFDPRLDKYMLPETATLRRGQQQRQQVPVAGVRHEKKISGLEKVKQLFTGSLKRNKTKPSAKPMPAETDSLSRYREYRGGTDYHDSKVNITSTHRPRLSTPRSSPVVSAKRTQSFLNSSKSSTISTTRPQEQPQNNPQKSGWFKSLDRLTARKKPLDTRKDDAATIQRNKPRPLSPRNEKVPSKNLRYFGDTDLESIAYTSKENKPKADKYYKSRNQSAMMGHNKISQSAYNLNNIWDDKTQLDQKHTPVKFQKSLSLENIDRDSNLKTKRNRNKSRSRELHDISESLSASDTDLIEHQRRDVSPTPNDKHHRAMKNERNVTSQRTTNRTTERSPVRDNFGSSYRTDETNMSFEQKRHLFEDKRRSRYSPTREQSQERAMFPFRKNYEISLSPNGDTRKPPPGRTTLERQKPKRRTVSRERDRDRERDSSGTEGESSMQSQRNVVFLHATTVGEIPSSYRTERTTNAMSREDLSTKKPSTRSVSRSISVLAPWKPKHMSEGFEIDYAQNENKYPVHRNPRAASSAYSRHLPPPGSSATMLKKNKKTKALSRSKSSLKDDRFSEQSSSFNSSTNRQYRDYRNTDSLSRRK